MRNLTKTKIPLVLEQNHESWQRQLDQDPSGTNKYRYRHPEIKAALREETYDKCVYCESKVGHNTPGDVEHMVPSSVSREQHYDWQNLTIACTECNRRKNDYYQSDAPFLNPYRDDVEHRVLHAGPVVVPAAGDEVAEISVSILELDSPDKRRVLFAQKVATLKSVGQLINSIVNTSSPYLKKVLQKRLQEYASPSAEYSAMVLSLPNAKDFLAL